MKKPYGEGLRSHNLEYGIQKRRGRGLQMKDSIEDIQVRTVVMSGIA